MFQNTNISTVEAFTRIRNLANRGRVFRYDEVMEQPPTGFTFEEWYGGISSDRAYGIGFELERQLPITHDQYGRVESTIKLRVLVPEKNGSRGVYIYVGLTWNGANGKHRSYAIYDLTPERLAYFIDLVGDNPARSCEVPLENGIRWHQQFGDDEDLVTDAIVQYHRAVVVTVSESGPPWCAMLSDSEEGDFGLDELRWLYTWLMRNDIHKLLHD